MKFSEVLDSGEPFAYVGPFHDIEDVKWIDLKNSLSHDDLTFTKEMLLSNCWRLKPEEITITKEIFLKIFPDLNGSPNPAWEKLRKVMIEVNKKGGF